MLVDAATIPARTLRRVEACVIGSGAGGGVAAAKLAEHGLATLLIEEGEYHAASTMTQREDEMLPRLFRDEGRRATSDLSISLLQGRALGGGTTHNTGLCVPAGADLWSEWQAAGGAPCSHAEYLGYAERVLAAIGARPVLDDEVNENNRLLEDGARRLGWSAFRARHNRIRCSGCGYCTLGCAYNRKLSVVHAFLPNALAHGLEIWTGCRARRLERQGPALWRVVCGDARGVELHVDTPIVVVAAGAIDTPLLLARSGIVDRRRAGSSLRLHPFAPVAGLFDKPVIAWRGVPQSVLIDEHAHAGHGGGIRATGGFHLLAAAAQPAVSARMSAALGAEHRHVMENYARLAVGGVLLRDTTLGRVSEGWGGAPRIHYWPNEEDRSGFRRGIRALAELYFEMGARKVFLPLVSLPVVTARAALAALDDARLEPHDLVLGSVHPQGTCPMGAGAADSITGLDGEVHGAPGVFVADASLFPRSLGLPPQVTIMSLAWRIADRIATG